MSRCRNCKVEVLDETDRCPLCHSVLDKTVEMENMYPNVWVRSRLMMRISRIYLFCAILLEAMFVYINVVTESEIWWCSITGLSLLYGYMVIRFAILGKSGYRMKTILLTLIAILMVIAIDFVVGYRGWSVNYALPAGILLIDAGILLLMVINRRNWQSYLMWQILMILCSMIPLILGHLGIETVRILSILPMAASVFLFLGTVIIGDRRARIELYRRFHIK